MEKEIFGEKIFLKKLRSEDAEKLNLYIKEPKLNEYSGPYKSSKSVEEALNYIKKCNENMKEGKSYHFGIYEKEKGEIVGVIGFFDLDSEAKKGEIGFWIVKDYWNRGLMSEAVILLTRFIFEELGCHRIYAHFHEKNIAVARILQKAGFEKEGELKDELVTNGQYYNDLIYGIVKD
jgi:RimJ/RimL family protein N-acetyltransferase